MIETDVLKKDKNGSVLPISVNVSRVNFYRTNLVSNLLELVEKYNLEPKDLQLEITETDIHHLIC
ncbi:MAG: EAL domain-containing protein [Eubacterium ventriosum]|nr:EAL domain-containing protein [Eubacterium ventriosum]